MKMIDSWASASSVGSHTPQADAFSWVHGCGPSPFHPTGPAGLADLQIDCGSLDLLKAAARPAPTQTTLRAAAAALRTRPRRRKPCAMGSVGNLDPPIGKQSPNSPNDLVCKVFRSSKPVSYSLLESCNGCLFWCTVLKSRVFLVWHGQRIHSD